MATHLVTFLSQIGWDRVPEPARSLFSGYLLWLLAGLPVVPSLGLVWPGPVLPALPATTTGRLRRPAAASPPLLLLLDEAGMSVLEQAGMLLLDQAGMVLL